jgi:p-aminobenzoyl-glutamate transporter AbgT
MELMFCRSVLTMLAFVRISAVLDLSSWSASKVWRDLAPR